MNDKELRALVLSAMRKLEGDGPEYPGQGICHNVEVLLEEFKFDIAMLSELLTELFKSWPHFNGDQLYPIGGGRDEYYLAMEQYLDPARGCGGMWDREGDYGALRWDLLIHCIQELSK